MTIRRRRAKTGGAGSRRRLRMITAAAGMDPSARARKAGEMGRVYDRGRGWMEYNQIR